MISEKQVEQAALAMLAARGVQMSGLLPPDAIWLAYPKEQAFAEARAALTAALSDEGPDMSDNRITITLVVSGGQAAGKTRALDAMVKALQSDGTAGFDVVAHFPRLNLAETETYTFQARLRDA